MTDTCADLHACSWYLGHVSRTQFGDSARSSRSFFLVSALLKIEHLRGGPFDTWGGGLWFFLRDQTFFFDSQLKRTIFFRPYQKQTIFLSAVKLKQFFSPFISFDSPYTVLSSQGVNTLPDLFTMFFDNEKLLYEICRTELLKLCKNFNFWSKVRVLNRFQYKLEGERSEPKIFITIFPHYNLLIKHFFSIFSWTNYFFPQVAEQTIYFQKFAEQPFIHKKTIAPPPPRNQMVGPLTSSPCFIDHIIQLNLTGSSLVSDAILTKIALFCQKVKVILSFKYWPLAALFIPDQGLALVKNAHVPRLGQTLISIFMFRARAGFQWNQFILNLLIKFMDLLNSK